MLLAAEVSKEWKNNFFC